MLLQNLRIISRDALDKQSPDWEGETSSTLKRVVRLLHRLSAASMSAGERLVSVPHELHSLLAYRESLDTTKGRSRGVIDLVHLLAREALPNDFLRAFSMWTASHDELSDTVHVLQAVLGRGVQRAIQTELSGSLLRLRRARQNRNKPSESSNALVDGRSQGHGTSFDATNLDSTAAAAAATKVACTRFA